MIFSQVDERFNVLANHRVQWLASEGGVGLHDAKAAKKNIEAKFYIY